VGDSGCQFPGKRNFRWKAGSSNVSQDSGIKVEVGGKVGEDSMVSEGWKMSVNVSVGWRIEGVADGNIVTGAPVQPAVRKIITRIK
jgi:hypothetical protein